MESKHYNETLKKLNDLIKYIREYQEFGDIFYIAIIEELEDIKKKIIEWY